MLALVAVFMIIIAILLRDNLHFYFSCHIIIIAYFLKKWYNGRWKGDRVVDGAGLENQRVKAPQVRILSFPPYYDKKDPEGSFFILLFILRL